MPRALPGSSAPASASTGGSGSSTRSDTGASAGSSRRDFDAMLKRDPGSSAKAADKPRVTPGNADPARKPGKPAAASADGSNAAGDSSKRPSSDASTAATDSTSATATTTAPPGDTAPATDIDSAPWPPLGLAGLALAGLEAPAPAPLPPPLSAAATADPLLAAATIPPAAAPTPALPGAAAAAAPAEPAAAITLPADAELSADPQLLKAVTDALAQQDGGDAPAPPLLHALQAAAEIKAGAVSPAFTGSPTATPDVGADDFGEAMSARIGWLADQKIGHAVIRVTPHDLGQIEVRLQIDGDKVHASFSSAHAEVRHALETNMPRLREMLGEQGFQLGNADVGQQHTAQDGKAGDGKGGAGGGSDGEPALADVTVSPAQLMRQRGLVDAYA